MAATETITAPPTDTGEVLCPMCDYNLHGLSDPRCPECGYTFEWPDLTDPTRRKHKYLFEHHPDRNAWSFVRTALGGLLPWRFWRSLRPEQPSNLRRLVVYWLITAGGVLLLPPCVYATACVVQHARYSLQRAFMAARAAPPATAKEITAVFGSVEAWLDQVAPVALNQVFFERVWQDVGTHPMFGLMLAGVACFVALPWATALSLMLFQATMRRARVRGAHVLRCCLYSFDGGWWFGLLLIALFTAVAVDAQLNAKSPVLLGLSSLIAMIAATVVMLGGVVKLLFAYRLYMRFPHAITTVVLALLVAILLLATIVVNAPGMGAPLQGLWHLL